MYSGFFIPDTTFLRWEVAAKNFRFNKWEKFFDRKDPPNKLFTLLKKLGCLQYWKFFSVKTLGKDSCLRINNIFLKHHVVFYYAACQCRRSQSSETSQKLYNNLFFHTCLNHLSHDVKLIVTAKETISLKAAFLRDTTLA